MFTRFAVSLAAALCLAELAYAEPPAASPSRPEKILPPAEFLPADKAPPVPWDDGDPDGARDRWWVSADYLFGWVRASKLPPLVTTSPAGTPLATAGVLGQPGTRTLFGNSDVDGDLRPGFRVDMGTWFDSGHIIGIDAGFFLLGSQDASFFANSPTGSPILARPFVNATSNAEGSQLVAFPGLTTGAVAASLRCDTFLGTNVDFQSEILTRGSFHLDGILGYRYIHFSDRLTIESNQTAAAGSVVGAGTQILAVDQFRASNAFNGADLGVRGEYVADGWSVGFLSKLAVGNVHRSVSIGGATRIIVPGQAPALSAGGLLALSSNSGTFVSNEYLAVAPEFGLTAGYAIRPNVHLRLGYSFLLLTDVARAADQVDLHVNPNLIPPVVSPTSPSSPAFHLRTADVWVQTLSLGLEFAF